MLVSRAVLIFLTLLIMSMTFVLSLTQMLVLLSLYVMLSILLSILVCASARLFCACLANAVAGNTQELCRDMSLRAYGKDAFEDIPVVDICRPTCHDYSLYLFVLVLFLGAVVWPQVYVAFNIFYQHIVHVDWGLSTQE